MSRHNLHADDRGPAEDPSLGARRPLELINPEPAHGRSDGEERPLGLDPLTLLRLAVLRYGWSISALICVGALIGAIQGMLQPNSFDSEAKLQLRLGAREQRTPEAAIINDLEVRRPGSDVVVADVLQVFSDPMVHQRVVTIVGADTILSPEDPTRFDTEDTSAPVRWMHELQAWWLNRAAPAEQSSDLAPADVAARILQGTLRVSTVFGQNTITITYTALSPERAREVVSACIEVFRARHREIYESESQLAFLEQQFDSASDDAEAARKELRDIRSEHQIVDFVSQVADLAELVLELTNLLDSERIELSAVKRQLEDLDQRFTGLEPLIPRPAGRVTTPNPVYPVLVLDHRRALEDLEELTAQFPEGSLQYEAKVKVIRERLNRLEKQLEGTGPILDLGEAEATLVENRLYDEIGDRRIDLQQQVLNLEGRLTEREAQLQRQSTRLEELRAIDFDYRMLETKVERLEGRVSALIPALDRARVLRALESDERLSNLKVIQEPTYQIAKTGPDRKKFLLMGLVAGLACGVAQALLRMLVDSKLRYTEELDAALQLELLGTIRECGSWRRVMQEQSSSRSAFQ